MNNEIKNSKVEEIEYELQLLWTLLMDGTITVVERNLLSSALQNELAEALKSN